jgi:hypothetical protein
VIVDAGAQPGQPERAQLVFGSAGQGSTATAF